MSKEPETQPSASIFRFSLRGLLLVTALVALADSHFYTSLRLRTVTAENQLLRQEVNRFSLEDESLLHVAALQSPDPLTWRWRLHVPDNGKFVLRTEYANLPERGLPTKRGLVGDELPKGDVLATASIHKDSNQHWTIVTFVPAPKVKSRFFIPEANSTWIEERASLTIRQMGLDGVKAIPRGEVAQLLRGRREDRSERNNR